MRFMKCLLGGAAAGFVITLVIAGVLTALAMWGNFVNALEYSAGIKALLGMGVPFFFLMTGIATMKCMDEKDDEDEV